MREPQFEVQRSGWQKAGKAILVTLGVALSLLVLLVVIVIGICSTGR